MIVNVHQAKSQLSKLMEKAEAGEEVIIARAGKPAVRLVPYTSAPRERQAGIWRNQIAIADDFDVLPDELSAAFEGLEG